MSIMDIRKHQASHFPAASAAKEDSKEHVQNGDSGRRFLQRCKESPKKAMKYFLIGGMTIWPIEFWTLEHGEDLMSKVPYTASFGIIACSMAWKWKTASVLVFRTHVFFLAVYSSMLAYFCHISPGFVARSRAPTFFFAMFMLFLDLLALILSRLQRVARSQHWQDEEKGGEAGLQNKDSESIAVAPGSERRGLDRSTRPKVSARKSLVSRLALALLVLVNIATLISSPPKALSNYLATAGCSVRIEDVHNDRAHLRFTAQARNSSSSTMVGPSCNLDRQISVIQREMNKHAEAVISANTASAAAIPAGSACAVYCYRKMEDGDLMGTISQALDAGALPDMSLCRGQHGFYGDCEAVGEKLGYDTTKEGWLNDVRG